MARGFVYLTAVVDVASRMVLAHKVAITLEACHAKEIIEQAFARYGLPEIVNTDQGSQFTADEFTYAVLSRGCKLSMDGKGAWRDNVFVERLWRSVKYERVYLRAYGAVSEAKADVATYIDWYNRERVHSSIEDRPPEQAYWELIPRLFRLHKMKIPDANGFDHRCRSGQLCINSTRPQSLYLLG
jgi:putative transposase